MKTWAGKVKVLVVTVVALLTTVTPSGKFQIPSTKFQFVWDLGFGIWDLGFPSVAGFQAQPFQGNGDTIGSETCKLCHEDLYRDLSQSGMFAGMAKQLGSCEHVCEACHGGGREHAEGGGEVTKIFNFKGQPPGQINRRCLACHESQEERHNFRQSEHGLNQLACTDCHSPHRPQSFENLLIKSPPELCYRCHGEIRQEFAKPFHHRVPEGGLSCIDCHNQHGGYNVTQTREAAGGTDIICVKCHTEKQGPFVFEHAPVKLEGCTICHQPHGSNNPRMHRRPTVHLLCLECHADTPGVLGPEPPAFHDIRTPRYQNCTVCHVEIHGSNASRFFFQ